MSRRQFPCHWCEKTYLSPEGRREHEITYHPEERAAQPPRPRGHPAGPEEPKVCVECNIPLAEHWRCTKCGCYGHLIPRWRNDPPLCLWCAQDLAAQAERAKEAA